MKKGIFEYWKDILFAVVISVIGYIILRSTPRTSLVDMSIEAALWLTASMIALRGFLKSRRGSNKNFRRFETFWGLTYLCVGVSYLMGTYYFIKNPAVIEIEIAEMAENSWLIIMSLLKSFSVVLLTITWIYFYKYLNIKVARGKKIAAFFIGVLLYLGASIIIWQLTNDITVLSLGIIIGCIVGIVAMIALDKKTRYLSMLFLVYSSVHLYESYIMGIGRSVSAGINNPVYWCVTILYILEIRRWIKHFHQGDMGNQHTFQLM